MEGATGVERARRDFEALFQRNAPRVLAYALRRSRTEQDAEDAVAETFAVAWRRRADLPADAQLPYLYGICRRVLANQRRGDERRVRLLDRLRLHQPSSPSPSHAGSDRATTALAALRPDDQELLRLVAWEGLDHREIAFVLQVTPNAVAIRLHRARERFARAFAAIGAGGVKGSPSVRTSTPAEGRTPGAAPRERTR